MSNASQLNPNQLKPINSIQIVSIETIATSFILFQIEAGTTETPFQFYSIIIQLRYYFTLF